ncbi:hypothetical protein EOK76_g0952 [Lacticaseibacillus paracasei]|nr:hypothetical protein EOK76_g0952 [Lacticaseibacillus paracasei]
MRYPKRAYTFSVDYFSTPESVDPKNKARAPVIITVARALLHFV